MTDQPKRPTGEEILNLPLVQATSDDGTTIRDYLSEVLWFAWNRDQGTRTTDPVLWRHDMTEALNAAGLSINGTTADGRDPISSAILALGQPPENVEFEDIREGDLLKVTVQGHAAFGESSGVYLRQEPEPCAYNTAWIANPVCGEPVAFQRLKAVPHGVPRPLLRDALDALRAANPDRSAEIDAARVHIDQTRI